LRYGEVHRESSETQIRLSVNLDADSESHICTTVPFLDHMLEAASFHGKLGIDIQACGDIEIDGHHLVEDVGICLGRAVGEALGDFTGIRRFAHVVTPMDECLVSATVDLSGRPHYASTLDLAPRDFGIFHTDLVDEFFTGFCSGSQITLHMRQLAGGNAHHLCEAAFKSFGRALGEAAAVVDCEIRSTKGFIDK